MNSRNSLLVAGMMARSIKFRKLTTTNAGNSTKGDVILRESSGNPFDRLCLACGGGGVLSLHGVVLFFSLVLYVISERF